MPPRRAARAALFVLFASAAFATSSPLARWARPAHALLVGFARLALAAGVLVFADRHAMVATVRGITLRQGGILFSAGALLAAHIACFLWGLDHTSYPAAVSLVALEPLGVVMCAWALLGEAPSRHERMGVAIATAGAVVVAQGAGQGEHRLLGDAAVLAAGVLFGLYLAIARALKHALPARSYAALVYVSAAVTLAALLLVTPAAFQAPAWPLPPHSLLAIVALGLVPTALGHTVVQTGSRSWPAGIVALVAPGETLGSLLIGALRLGAVPSRLELVGAAIILAGTATAIAGTWREDRAFGEAEGQ